MMRQESWSEHTSLSFLAKNHSALYCEYSGVLSLSSRHGIIKWRLFYCIKSDEWACQDISTQSLSTATHFSEINPNPENAKKSSQEGENLLFLFYMSVSLHTTYC